MTIARLPAVRNRNAAECTTLFRELLRDNSQYAAIFAADSEGMIFANALPNGNININNTKYFQDAVQTKAFSAGEYIIGPVSRRAVLPFACPVMDSIGRITGVVGISFDLEKYGSNFVSMKQFPEGSTLNLLDRNFIRLYRYPDNKQYTGQVELSGIVRQISKGPREGIFTSAGVDGVKRYFAYKSFCLGDSTSPYLYIRIGIPVEQVLAPGRKTFIRNIGLLAVSLLAAILAAWLTGRVLIVKRLNRLLSASRQLGHGDLSIRTGIDHEGDELAQLARSFEEMAEALEAKELDRRKTEETLLESEIKFKSYEEQALVGIYLIQDGVFKYVNNKFAQMFSYTVEECLDNMHFETLICEDDRSSVREQVRKRTSREVEFVHYTFRGLKKDGQIFDVEIYGSSSVHQGRPAAAGTILDITERKKAEEEREKLIAEIQHALSEVKTLSGLLPICSSCKKIRDDNGYWNQMESYVRDHSNADFSHSICPDCFKNFILIYTRK